MDRRIWNHPYPDQQLNLDIAAVGGVNPMPYFDMAMRSNNLPSSNVNVEVPNHLAANPGPTHNPYLHASSASSSSRMPPNYVQAGPSCYNHFANGHASIAVNPRMEYGRAPSKRKNSAVPMAVDRGNTNNYYSAGNSSNLPIPSSTLQPNLTPGPQYWAWDPVSMHLSHRSDNLSTVGEGSHRNVRSRQCNASRLETHSTGPNLFSNPSHHHPSTNVSGLAVAGQWSHPPACLDSQRRVPSSGSDGFNREMNQSIGGSSSVNHNMEIDIGYRPNSVHNGSSSTPLPPLHGMSSQVMGVGHNGYGLGTLPYSAIASYQPMGFAVSLERGRRLGMEAIPPSRHSRPLSTVGQINERNGRSRTLYDRLQPFSSGYSAHSRWESEGVSMMDRSIIYDSRNLFDQHRDMRLDIDNMSYELFLPAQELLVLEERIGSVSTGLSENTISMCLKESVYCSSNEEPDEGNCVICLEEYKDKEGLGRLNCGHDFHASCIKKWLLIKSVCPICKGAALPDSSKEK
ncbi:putative E3 ubiquitin-protein ligase HIP1 [Iris pallida]|uniref:RING-type E3 ubiquitin transferase n=1 Tax=Iris pallida TaxID=29817 RepID=A0AAX6DPD2_IRIPA|nr:putative E3 ubiquitin-protein ligase HIP1 [Iris pallida]